MTLTAWIALAVIAAWVLFSGGSPVLKFIVYRLLFVVFAAAAVVGTYLMHQQFGLGPAVLTVLAIVVAWFAVIGPMISMPLYFRKNPRKLQTHS